MIARRRLLAYTVTLGLSGLALPRMAYARTAGNKRLVFLLLRGAVDGLAMLAPVADRAFAAQRGMLAEDFADAPVLHGLFALHPALAELGRLHNGGEALFAHAIATDYRERSHFEAQNLLETGGLRAYEREDGWLNRLLGLLPDAPRALALAPTIPMMLRGSHEVTSYAPSSLPDTSADFTARLAQLYADDAQLHALWQQAIDTQAMAGDSATRNLRNAQATGELAATLMAGDGGARVLTIELGGWDSHANQRGMLARQFGQLDALLAALRASLGEAWGDTLVIAATEFGRTVRINGTGGTDHGTAGAAFLLGGTVKGGRVLADWPGIGESQLFEGRDLRPTASLEALLAGAVAEHFALDPARALTALFPGRNLRASEGLLRS